MSNNDFRGNCVEVKIEMNDVSRLIGKLLTIADASFADKQQREGVKSIIKQTVWAWGKEWHVAATEEAIQEMAKNSENCLPPDEAQIKLLED